MAQKYDYLTVDERIAMMRPRITDAERRVFQLEVDTLGTNDPAAGMELAVRHLDELRKLEAELEKEKKA